MEQFDHDNFVMDMIALEEELAAWDLEELAQQLEEEIAA